MFFVAVFWVWKNGCCVKSIRLSWHANEAGKAIGCAWRAPRCFSILVIHVKDVRLRRRPSIWLSSTAPSCSRFRSIRNVITSSVLAPPLVMLTSSRHHVRYTKKLNSLNKVNVFVYLHFDTSRYSVFMFVFVLHKKRINHAVISFLLGWKIWTSH